MAGENADASIHGAIAKERGQYMRTWQLHSNIANVLRTWHMHGNMANIQKKGNCTETSNVHGKMAKANKSKDGKLSKMEKKLRDWHTGVSK